MPALLSLPVALALPECPVTYPAPAFDPQASTNVAVYWGQGSDQSRLVDICQTGAYDIINIGFINTFPNEYGNPGANFGNQCGSERYPNSDLPSNCPWIGQDIKTCQDVYGKKIFLSIGGASPNDYYLKDSDYAVAFADFLWKAFGPSKNDGTPRPFGDAVVDGFDFDIESLITPAPADAPNYQSQYYPDMVNHFHDVLFLEDTSKNYYISGAPQCWFPDPNLSDAFASSWFDFIFVQLYNNQGCNALASYMDTNIDFLSYTLPGLVSTFSRNPDVRVFAGLPATTEGAPSDPGAHLSPEQVYTWFERDLSWSPNFGGFMLWEATLDQQSTENGYIYSEYMKAILTGCGDGCVPNSQCSFLQYKPNKLELPVSTDGTCGASGQTCEGSTFGNCCSQWGNCGTTDEYCGAAYNCDIRYGLCGDDANLAPTCTSSTAITPTPTPVVTPVDTPVATPIDTPVVNTPVDTPIVNTPVLTPPAVNTPISTPAIDTPIFTPIIGTPVLTPPVVNTPVFTPPVDTPVFTPSLNTSVINTPVFTPSVNTPVGTPIFTPPVDTPVVNTPLVTPSLYTPPVLSPIGNLSIHLSTPSASSLVGASGTPLPSSAQVSGPTGSSPNAVSGITSAPTPPGSLSAPGDVTTTVITTTYVDVCPTGFTTITTTYTTTYTTTICPTQTPSAIPAGWTTVVTVCSNCGPQPTTLTLTRPISTAGGSAQSSTLTTSTVYATQLVTITACPPSVTNCPANSKTHLSVATTLVPVSTTVYPVVVSPSATKAVDGQTGQSSQGSQGSQSSQSSQGDSGNANTNGGFSTSTVYQTQLVTVTQCPPSVTNCPASAKTVAVLTTAVPAYLTVVPVATTTTRVGGSGNSVPSAGASVSASKQVYAGSSSSIVVAVPSAQSSVHGGSGSGSGSGSSSSSVSVVQSSNPSSSSAVGGSVGSSNNNNGSGNSNSGSGSGANTANTNVNANSRTAAATAFTSTTSQLVTFSVIPVPAASYSSASSYYYPLIHSSSAPAAAASSSAHAAAAGAASAPQNYNGTVVHLNTPSSSLLTPYSTPTSSSATRGSTSSSSSGTKTDQASVPVYTGSAASIGVRGVVVGGMAAVIAAAMMM
ncbi:Endochitinase 2 precursor [Lasiodiplodia theobromae]|uniref:Endochitinase 2 precursor n=1 Tax=Lasiodiplodia theobromae TaxID=45133 RepID=UPI0015C3F57E|nr:Endochitinase 2 precursor [Lasiodiplodia theobromae]KAF4542164.1 Endochitinase 2 precursor [Lasiodiplodia theobromae]